MKSQKEIRGVLDSLRDVAFRDYGLELSATVTGQYLETMAQERVAKLFDTTFSSFSISDLLNASAILDEDSKRLPAKKAVN